VNPPHTSNTSQWLFTEPSQNVFNFTEGEIVATKAEAAGFFLRCHALVWHSQLAPWVESTNWTAPALRDTITAHITHVAGHWKGRCYAWDVVNEALNEDGTYRPSVFYNVLGEDYIAHAFKVAAQVDPHAKLYYNDYNLESPGNKSAAAVGIVKMLRAEGIKIDGIGMQAHLTAESHPTLDEHVAVIESYSDAGVEVALTEVDVRITLPATTEKLELQKQAYKNVSANEEPNRKWNV
jgi:endo-1,4-beta-xylanase